MTTMAEKLVGVAREGEAAIRIVVSLEAIRPLMREVLELVTLDEVQSLSWMGARLRLHGGGSIRWIPAFAANHRGALKGAQPILVVGTSLLTREGMRDLAICLRDQRAVTLP